MANTESGSMKAEIKKEMLKEHLADVIALAKRLESSLTGVPDPFYYQRDLGWGWQRPCKLWLEDQPDDKHTLKFHLRGRQLWLHYTQFKETSEEVWNLINAVRTKSGNVLAARPKSKKLEFTDAYLGSAIYTAFQLVLNGKKPGWEVKGNGDSAAVIRFGTYVIENSAEKGTDKKSVKAVEDELNALIRDIVRIPDMAKLKDEWLSMKDLSEKMSGLVRKALKGRDILYPCRYCKHLWR